MIPLTLGEIATIVHGDVDAAHADVLVASAASVDSRAVEPGGLFVAVVGEQVDGHDYAVGALDVGAAAVLASRPIDGPCVVVPDVTAALGLLTREVLRRIPALVVAITGSQGKTSVKDLIAHVLSPSGRTVAAHGSFNNDLGVPLTALRADADTDFLVLEMGARGIGHIARLCEIAPPHIGVVLNVGTAHLGEFGSADAIALAKGELVEALSDDGIAVLNADDPRTAAMAVRTSARVLSFGENGTMELGALSVDDAGEPSFTLSHAGETVAVRVPQIGAHHAINAAAAAAVCAAAGLDLTTIAERLGTATPRSPMRMARTTRSDGVLIIDDTYNANPDSMSAALRAVARLKTRNRRIAAVLGEMRELGEHSAVYHREMGEVAARCDYDLVVAVGEAAWPIADGAENAGTDVVRAADTDAATEVVSGWLLPGDVVLVKASRGARLERVTAALGA